VTPFVCPRNVRISFMFRRFHMRMVVSSLAEKANRPSGEMATAKMALEWPVAT
jgi:hypothetical protein